MFVSVSYEDVSYDSHLDDCDSMQYSNYQCMICYLSNQYSKHIFTLMYKAVIKLNPAPTD